MISCNMIPCTCGRCFACDICGKRAGRAHGPQHKQAHEAHERGKREGIRIERERVVAWLRQVVNFVPGYGRLTSDDYAAKAEGELK